MITLQLNEVQAVVVINDDNDCAVPNEDDLCRLVAFQPAPDPDGTWLLAKDWRAGDLQAAVGQYPVFAVTGGMFNLTVPITSVTA